MSAILETDNLSKYYGKTKALESVSLNIQQGEIYGLIGRNGAGKTTLLKIIAGLSRQSSGQYRIFGEKSEESGIAGSRIGCLIEHAGIYPNLNALQHLELKSLAMGIHDRDLAKHVLAQVGLAETGKNPVKKFSLGMKERLGIALALIGSPDLILLDEPMNGLDPQGIAEMRELIFDINQKENVTFIISSHILDELQKLATRFGIIDSGHLINEIDSDSLKALSRERIELSTPRADIALPILDQLGIRKYKVISENMIHIYEGLEQTGQIAVALAQQNIPILSISFYKSSLEDYYLNLTSGKYEM